MITRLLRAISLVVVILALLNVFAFSVKHIVSGGQRFGAMTAPLKTFINFPGIVLDVYEEMTSNVHHIEINPDFQQINKIDYDVYGLNGQYENPNWIIRLKNLRNDSIIHEWSLTRNVFTYHDRDFSHSEPREPILMDNRSVVFPLGDTYNLYRLDRESNVIWHQTDFRFHHALNLGHDGSIWTCTKDRVHTAIANNKGVIYYDDAVTNLDSETGKVKFHKSISEILFENGYDYLIHGMGNEVTSGGTDPMHLNDVEPVLEDGPFWKKGDLWLSFRHRSLILLYRPLTNEVLRIVQGPFFNQHDVDIFSETKISLFNNNVSSLSKGGRSSLSKTEFLKGPDNLNINSQVLIYDLEDSSFISYMDKHFQKDQIMTETEGLHHILNNGDLFVESQNSGKMYIISDDEILIKKYYNNPSNNMVERSHWIRLLENI